MSDTFDIREDDVTDDAVVALLDMHLREMHQWSPACQVHAMPVERLREADMTFFAAWQDDALAAIGAIKQLGPERGELKSMRAAPEFRGKGAGEAILLHLVNVAKQRGYGWLGLETGRPEPFRPAQRLYAKHGFAECQPFGDYISDEFSMCMERTL